MSTLTAKMQTQTLRGDILMILYQAGAKGAAGRLIQGALQKDGTKADEKAIADALFYLKGRGLCDFTTVKSELYKKEQEYAHITPAGMDVIEWGINIEGVTVDEG